LNNIQKGQLGAVSSNPRDSKKANAVVRSFGRSATTVKPKFDAASDLSTMKPADAKPDLQSKVDEIPDAPL